MTHWCCLPFLENQPGQVGQTRRGTARLQEGMEKTRDTEISYAQIRLVTKEPLPSEAKRWDAYRHCQYTSTMAGGRWNYRRNPQAVKRLNRTGLALRRKVSEGIVGKHRASLYDASVKWIKVRNRAYTQTAGRDDLFPLREMLSGR